MLDKILQPLVSEMSIFKNNNPMSLGLNTLQTYPSPLNFYKGGNNIKTETNEYIGYLKKISKKDVKTKKDINTLKKILSKYEITIKKI